MLVIALLLTLSASACGLIGKSRVADSLSQGSVQDNVYTSPSRSFRIRLPWLTDDATLRDESPTPNTTLVSIKDKLCREFVVSERPGFLGTQSLESWVASHIVDDLKQLGLKVESKVLSTRNGKAIALRYRAPAAAPCSETTEVDRKQVARQRDAEVAWQVYHHDGVFYRLIYSIGVGPGVPTLWYVKREPVDEVLAQFAEGFEILAMAKPQVSAETR